MYTLQTYEKKGSLQLIKTIKKRNFATQFMSQTEQEFKNIIAHCKEYGFVFPSSEIYDGLSAVYDYGQTGVALKNNLKLYW